MDTAITGAPTPSTALTLAASHMPGVTGAGKIDGATLEGVVRRRLALGPGRPAQVG
ncbi:hypothetical protein [Streptomyces atratus]|uniref:hypothetical protein n=1 Tax=Streptomyces atratus TaxID=1893 RepID=UPI00340AEC84